MLKTKEVQVRCCDNCGRDGNQQHIDLCWGCGKDLCHSCGNISLINLEGFGQGWHTYLCSKCREELGTKLQQLFNPYIQHAQMTGLFQ